MNTSKTNIFESAQKSKISDNKKGISALIETVLLILLVIAAVGLIAGLIVPMIRTAGERAAGCQGLIEITAANTGGVSYTQAKSGNVSSIAINCYNSAGASVAYTGTKDKPTSVGDVKIASPIPTGCAKISIIPVIVVGGGKEVTCPAIEAQIS